jgi:hypothetical protein
VGEKSKEVTITTYEDGEGCKVGIATYPDIVWEGKPLPVRLNPFDPLRKKNPSAPAPLKTKEHRKHLEEEENPFGYFDWSLLGQNCPYPDPIEEEEVPDLSDQFGPKRR